ncbi:MAG: HNH endonuclease [Candidatus Nanopelagicales bacterium]
MPDYRDQTIKMGSMVRCACWLATAVGEGGVFTKAQLRDAVPGVEQIDRRMRDLRDFGWRIDESRMTSDLQPDELRLVRIGVPVWDHDARKAAKKGGISSKVRQEVFHRDGHACVRCGAAAGEYFDDEPGVRVRLTAAHLYPSTMGGKATAADLVTACQRCNEAIREQTPNYLDEQQVLARMRSLGRTDRLRLLQRMRTRRRETDKVDDVWRAYLQLPGVERSVVEEALAALLKQ